MRFPDSDAGSQREDDLTLSKYSGTTSFLGKRFMSWIMLFCAGLFEIVWAVGLKYSEGFSRFWPSLITLVALAASMVLLGLSLRTLPLGTAYAIWTGIGAVGTVILGIFLFGESASLFRLLCIVLIVLGIMGLKFGPA